MVFFLFNLFFKLVFAFPYPLGGASLFNLRKIVASSFYHIGERADCPEENKWCLFVVHLLQLSYTL